MKKTHLLLILLLLPILAACSKPNDPRDFPIVGKWGMVSGVIANQNGSVTYYEPMGTYYQFLEFKSDRTLVKTELPNRKEHLGKYSYDPHTGRLQIDYYDTLYDPPVSLTIFSPDEIEILTDYDSDGYISQRFKRIKYNLR